MVAVKSITHMSLLHRMTTAELDAILLPPAAVLPNVKPQYWCQRCRSTDVDYELVQKRAADEGMSARFVCRACHHRWMRK